MKETARLYFAGDDVTVNLIPATIILLLLTLGEFVKLNSLSVSNDQIHRKLNTDASSQQAND